MGPIYLHSHNTHAHTIGNIYILMCKYIYESLHITDFNEMFVQ